MSSWENNNQAPQLNRGSRQGSFSPSLAFFILIRNKQVLYSLSILLILGIAYGATLAPGLTWANGGTDGGDLITAASTHGVAHPGGYPLYLLLAQVFQQIPLGNLAWRTNLMSAVCMILAVILLYLTTRRLLTKQPFADLAAWGAALAFGISSLVWSQAVITEVYALQILLTVCILFQTLAGKMPWNVDFLRGLILGLALGNHLTTLFLIPLLIWDGDTFCPDLKKHLGRRILGVLAGLLIYLLLPLWAFGKPPINWGNPITFTAFFQLVAGQIYQSNFTSIYTLDRLRGWAGLLIEQVGLAGLFIGAFYLFGGWERLKKTGPLLWIFPVYGLFALMYGSYDSYVYLIPSVMAFTVWMAAGLQEIILLLVSRWRAGWIPGSLLLVLALAWQVVQVAPKVDASKDLRAETFGKMAMHTLPENALVFTRDDETTFTLWYFHYGLKERADIAVIVEGLMNYDWYRTVLGYTYPDLRLPQVKDLSRSGLAAANPSREICPIKDHLATSINCSKR
jgi:hypothetical protein